MTITVLLVTFIALLAVGVIMYTVWKGTYSIYFDDDEVQ